MLNGMQYTSQYLSSSSLVKSMEDSATVWECQWLR